MWRSSSGLRLMEMRPLFRVVLMPSAPMKEDRLSTAGSCRMMLRQFLLLLGHRGERDGLRACEMPWITPVSCTGKNPLGMTM